MGGPSGRSRRPLEAGGRRPAGTSRPLGSGCGAPDGGGCQAGSWAGGAQKRPVVSSDTQFYGLARHPVLRRCIDSRHPGDAARAGDRAGGPWRAHGQDGGADAAAWGVSPDPQSTPSPPTPMPGTAAHASCASPPTAPRPCPCHTATGSHRRRSSAPSYGHRGPSRER